MSNPRIPQTMSTQHPDNVRSPFFADSTVIGGEDEIKEAFYCYSHLKIREQLWDFEGKDVDNSVVRKLLTNYEAFFRKNRLGKEVFLTYRVPNPEVAKDEGKVLAETLESIPRGFDTARMFYGEDIAPVFEVAVPMVTNATSVIRVSEYYKKIVAGKEDTVLFEGDSPLSSWLGKFEPDSIRVIPLIEDKDSLLAIGEITEQFMRSQRVKDYQRVWLARSDPALNYGSLATVLLGKIALQCLRVLEEKLSVPIHPILGCGSAPFRGNLRPTTVDSTLQTYGAVHTFTLQSAFKYDYDEDEVRRGVEKLEEHKPKRAETVDEEKLLPIIEKTGEAYQRQIALIAPLVNQFSTHIPRRRARKLHIGLFGYSRQTAGVKLPRAIPFCAALYSLGLPPELFGLHVLTGGDLEVVTEVYPRFEQDFRDAVKYFNPDNLDAFPEPIRKQVLEASRLFATEPDEKHRKVTSIILSDWKTEHPVLTENIERAAAIRGFLG